MKEVEVRLTFGSFEEAQAFLSSHAAAPAAEAETTKAEDTPKTPRRTKKKAVAAKAKPDPEPQAEATEPEAEDTKPEKPPTVDDAREAAMRLRDAKGMPGVLDTLRRFGAGKVSEVPEDKRAEFIAACDKEVA